MSETYVECLIKAKQSKVAVIFRGILIVLTIVFAIGAFIGFIEAFLLAVACGVGAYFLNLLTDLEYEYLYLDKELTVDKIMAKTNRKKVETLSVDRMEVVAPLHSHQLDSYKNREVKVKDYSIGEALKPDMRYAIYYEGGVKIIISPSEELVKALKNVAPRKVFTE